MRIRDTHTRRTTRTAHTARTAPRDTLRTRALPLRTLRQRPQTPHAPHDRLTLQATSHVRACHACHQHVTIAIISPSLTCAATTRRDADRTRQSSRRDVRRSIETYCSASRCVHVIQTYSRISTSCCNSNTSSSVTRTLATRPAVTRAATAVVANGCTYAHRTHPSALTARALNAPLSQCCCRRHHRLPCWSLSY